MRRLVPEPLESVGEYDRFYSLDLPSLDDTELIDELHALRPLLWWKLSGDEWLRERVRVLETELARRRGERRQGVRR